MEVKAAVNCDEDYRPSLRVCTVARPLEGSCGFHLSRTTWDPYPWISEVDSGSAAEQAGLQVGDCVLEVNDEDVLGQRIAEVGLRVHSKGRRVKLLLWNAGSDSSGTIWLSGGNGPTPLSLQRLAVCLQSVVQLLECPVCLETSPPPVYQCCNGHLLCGDCRAHADRCPVCRVHLGSRGRCLLADKLYSLLTSTFFRECNPKKRKGLFRNKGVPRLKVKSRLPKQLEDRDDEMAAAISGGGAPPSPSPSPSEASFRCPSGDCERPIAASHHHLLQHIQTVHEGPFVQYFAKEDTTALRLPTAALTAINRRGTLFFVHVVAHRTAGRLSFSLRVAGDKQIARLYRFNVSVAGITGTSSQHSFVLPLTEPSHSSENCIVLDDVDIDKIDSVDLTISVQNDDKLDSIDGKLEE